jgi:hypothetical protein
MPLKGTHKIALLNAEFVSQLVTRRVKTTALSNQMTQVSLRIGVCVCVIQTEFILMLYLRSIYKCYENNSSAKYILSAIAG